MAASGKVGWLVLLLAFPGLLAGCAAPAPDPGPPPEGGLGGAPTRVADGLAALAAARASPLVLERPFTVHVVLVGIDPAILDEEAARAALPRDTSPGILFSPALPGGLRSGLSTRIRYEFHEAPGAFAEDLFASYPDLAQEIDVPEGEQGFLARYDAMYGLGRAASGKMHLVDARGVEERIEALRGEHGLRFEGPHATVFLLDSWTRHGLWKDSYHWYGFQEDLFGGGATQDMRAWGGTYDFLFLDHSAAPNDASQDNSGFVTADFLLGSLPAYAPEGTAYNDPPAWHYEGETATIGKGALEKTVRFTDRVVHWLDVAVNIRLLEDYAFRPSYAERYHVNVHLWHDGRSIIPPDALPRLLDGDALRASLQSALPWAEVGLTLKTYLAPRDDPGMDAAMTRAKAEGAGAQLSMPILFQHVEAHPERYKRNEPGTLDVMALGFLLEGHYSVVVPGVPGGAAVLGPDWLPWGATASVNDASYLRAGQSLAWVSTTLSHTNAHELGHFFGLNHAHDGTRRTPDGYAPWLEPTWSSTNTAMSYRIATTTVDHLHRVTIARAHALDNLGRTLRDLQSAYRALEAAGHADVPPAVHAPMASAAAAYDEALRLYAQGRDEEAVAQAIGARRAAEEAMRLAGVAERTVLAAEWSAEGVNAVGRKHSAFVLRPGVTPTGILKDYRPVALDGDAERVTVRVTWTNGPASWGDLFVGWRSDALPPFVDLGPAASFVSLGEGIHDDADEGPTDGRVTREFTLDLDHMPALRQGATFEAGAGAQGTAVDVAYDVEVWVTSRVHDAGA